MKPWPKLDQTSQKIGWRTVVTKQFKAPDGNTVEFVTFHEVDGRSVAVVALTPDNQVIIARQFRAGPERIFEEMPGGGVDDDEDPAVAAKRELLEETGYTSDAKPLLLGSVTSDGYSNATSYFYLLKNCTLTSKQQLDSYELVDVRLISLSQLRDNAYNNRMSDAVGALMALDYLRTEHSD